MIVVNKNKGMKIPYEVNGTKICFDDDLTINLAKREQNWDVHIDICFDENDELVIGAAVGRAYVAEIDILARTFLEVEDDSGDDAMGGGTKMKSVPVPLDMDKVTLSLWSIE